MADVLRPAYRGDEYAFTLTFPDASYLVGAPANVKAQIKAAATDASAVATWAVTVESVDGVAKRLRLSLDEVTLPVGRYVTDVQVGSVTYLPKTAFVVEQDVSR